MTDELNPGPCPFCGSERVTVMTTQDVPPWPPNGYVICSGCSARGPRCENREQALARWNAAGQDTIILWKLLAAIVLYRYWFDTCSKTAAPNWELLAGDASEKLDTALELADKAVGSCVASVNQVAAQIIFDSRSTILALRAENDRLNAALVRISAIRHAVSDAAEAANYALEIADKALAEKPAPEVSHD
jgi:hypothetical protein